MLWPLGVITNIALADLKEFAKYVYYKQRIKPYLRPFCPGL